MPGKDPLSGKCWDVLVGRDGLSLRALRNLFQSRYPHSLSFSLLIPVLSSSFNTFVEFVPFPEWRRFGRTLGLRENNLYQAEQNDRGSGEPLYQMLNMWLNKEGSKASVNTLLETLSQINLSGVADLIASELIRNGYFQYEVS